MNDNAPSQSPAAATPPKPPMSKFVKGGLIFIGVFGPLLVIMIFAAIKHKRDTEAAQSIAAPVPTPERSAEKTATKELAAVSEMATYYTAVKAAIPDLGDGLVIERKTGGIFSVMWPKPVGKLPVGELSAVLNSIPTVMLVQQLQSEAFDRREDNLSGTALIARAGMAIYFLSGEKVAGGLASKAIVEKIRVEAMKQTKGLIEFSGLDVYGYSVSFRSLYQIDDKYGAKGMHSASVTISIPSTR